jgi:hypothetical protein
VRRSHALAPQPPIAEDEHEDGGLPAITAAGNVIRRRRPDSHKLPAELTDAELLTKVLGPSIALSCEWLTTTYDDLRAIALLSHADLSHHGLTTGAIHKLGAVFEIAKRYGECEWSRGVACHRAGQHWELRGVVVVERALAARPALGFQATFTVTHNLTRVFFCSARTMSKKFSVLGLPCGASIRCRLLLYLFTAAASASKPTVALTRSRKMALLASPKSKLQSFYRGLTGAAMGSAWMACPRPVKASWQISMALRFWFREMARERTLVFSRESLRI